MNNPASIQHFAVDTPAPAPRFAPEQPERVAFLRHYSRLFWRWRLVFLGSIIGFMLLGLIITLLMTPQYTAETTVEISRESDQIVNIQGVQREASVADQEFYQTQYGLLEARSLANRVAEELELANNNQFFDMFGADEALELLANSPNSGPARAERQRIATDLLLDNVDISPTRESRLVEIAFTSPDAQFSQTVANAWAENFIRESLERRYDATSYARNFLENRLGQLRTRLNESESELMNYAQQQRIITLPGQGAQGSEQSTVAYDLVSLNNALAAATADRIAAEAKLRETGGRSSGDSAEALENNALNVLRARRAEVAADYQRMLAQFQPEYPPAQALERQLNQIDQSIAREERRVGDSIRNAFETTRARENALESRVEQLKGDFLDQRRRSIRYTIFQREVDTNRQLYDALLQRYKEIGVAGGVGVNNIAIVDPAIVPERPSSPRLLLNLLLSLVCGIAVGAGLAFLLEQSDEAITDPEEIKKVLGLPLLGTIPKVPQGTPEEALLDRKSEVVEAYLAVQTNLQLTSAQGIPRTVAVTSTRPTEGKSTTAFALATMLARSNARVVLIDGDMRSPSVHQLLGVPHEQGLSNILAGADRYHDMLIDVKEYGFQAITAGPIPPNAAELLTSDRLSQTLATLRRDFDYVVIDAPPVMGLADAPLIGSRVEGVIYAVEANGVRSTFIKSALARLNAAHVPLLGAVLTKFESKRARYGYGYEYGYNYGEKDRKGAPVLDV